MKMSLISRNPPLYMVLCVTYLVSLLDESSEQSVQHPGLTTALDQFLVHSELSLGGQWELQQVGVVGTETQHCIDTSHLYVDGRYHRLGSGGENSGRKHSAIL